MNYAERKNAIHDKTFSNLVSARLWLATLQAIQPVIGQFVGKKITKRIATAAAKVLPGDMVSVLSWSGAGQFSMAYLTIWGGGLPYDSRVNLFLGYGGDLEEEKADISGWIKSTQEYVAGAEAALENLDSLLVKHSWSSTTSPCRSSPRRKSLASISKAWTGGSDMTDYNPDAAWKHYLVTVDIPMPNGMDAPRPLRTTVSIQAPHADAARWRVESYSPVRIIDVQEQKVEA